MRKWMKIAALSAVGLGVIAAIAVAAKPDPVPVELGVAALGTMRVTVDEDGRTRVKDSYIISAPLTGNLARIELEAGDTVREGQTLARMWSAAPPLLDVRSRAEARARLRVAEAAREQARAAVAQAEVAAEQARREAERARTLLETRSITRQMAERAEAEAATSARALDSAIFASRVAENELELARVAVSTLNGGAGDVVEVQAPVAGRVLRVFQESAGVIAAGAPLLEVGDPGALEIVADVITTDAVRIDDNAKVAITRWGGEDTLEGHVVRVEPSAFTKVSALGIEEQRVNVLIAIDDPRERWTALGDGFRVEVRIEVYAKDDVLIVPAGALYREKDAWMLFAVEEGRAVPRRVEVARTNGLEAEVTGGIELGTPVILHPSDRITPGVRVVERS